MHGNSFERKLAILKGLAPKLEVRHLNFCFFTNLFVGKCKKRKKNINLALLDTKWFLQTITKTFICRQNAYSDYFFGDNPIFT